MRYLIGNRSNLKFYQKLILGLFPFLIVGFLYNHFSNLRLEENPNDKVLPSISKMYNSFSDYSTKIDKRSGKNQFVEDVKASLIALSLGIIVSLFFAIIIGVMSGTYPIINSLLNPIINVLSAIPPAAIVPILFLIAQPGFELSILFIFISLFFILVKDIVHQIKSIPQNLNTLLFSKGASELEIAKENFYMIVPGVLNSLKLNLPLVWFALLFAETLGAQDGLGTRIFILKRFSANEIIFPYILVITIIAVSLFFTIDFIIKKRYPWFSAN